ncbi:MAG: right-handed parallel beta-helix repeat-containing protein, partial [Candidatus Thermoplasmatota archaeon]|nr:right-handed parallel beta-helix repeat-containing protein [Candidatus Thermoplasmatota archaeon]
FIRNTFINNTATSASNGGLFYNYKNAADILVRDCVFINNSANCLVFHWSYQYYTTTSKDTLTFENNKFFNNTGKGIVYTESSDESITIRGNEAYGNEDYVVYIDHARGYQYYYNEPDHQYLYTYGVPRGPLELMIEANNFSYNPGGGIWAKVSQYDAQYASYGSGQPNADIRVKKNMLYGNGPDGWSLGLDGLYRSPTVKSNRLDGSSKGQFWGIVTGDPARTVVFDMQIRDVVMDGGPEGRTAYGFHNIEVEFYDCTFTNFSKCFFADDCRVDVYWSGVPEASGETQNDGKIYIWNHLEIWVTWANAEGVDSGIPAPKAIVAMQGANGRYFGAMKTNEEGKLLDRDNDPLVINPWISEDGVMEAWSPFTITLLAQENVSSAHQVSVVQDFVDPNPLRLTLIDMFKPEVIIANPQDDTLVNVSDVLAEGFLFEIGSGIKLFEGRSDMMPEDEWVSITRNVLWQHIFPQMTEGYHNLIVRAADISDNWNISIIEIIIDLQRPDLIVQLEYKNATKIPWDEEKGGYFVRDKEIAINGTYIDNYAHFVDIILRINGVAKFIFPSQWGTIWHPMELKQGINTIIIDATDTAGNRAVERLYISLDSHPPTMYIYNPLDGQMTANETMFVTGLTEPITRLDI